MHVKYCLHDGIKKNYLSFNVYKMRMRGEEQKIANQKTKERDMKREREPDKRVRKLER